MTHDRHWEPKPAPDELVPIKGLTFRRGGKESNVHSVVDGVVYYGLYRDGEDLPYQLHSADLSDWQTMAATTLNTGAVAFCLLPGY